MKSNISASLKIDGCSYEISIFLPFRPEAGDIIAIESFWLFRVEQKPIKFSYGELEVKAFFDLAESEKYDSGHCREFEFTKEEFKRVYARLTR